MYQFDFKIKYYPCKLVRILELRNTIIKDYNKSGINTIKVSETFTKEILSCLSNPLINFLDFGLLT